MRKHNISDRLLELNESLYRNSESSVLINNVLSEGFPTQVGVRQGCLLSPCLFNLFLKEIMTEALKNFEGTISVGGRNINNLGLQMISILLQDQILN